MDYRREALNHCNNEGYAHVMAILYVGEQLERIADLMVKQPAPIPHFTAIPDGTGGWTPGEFSVLLPGQMPDVWYVATPAKRHYGASYYDGVYYAPGELRGS